MLAGGQGTRLRPLTYATPKPLLPIANRPFLEHQLAWLAGFGVDEVVLSIGYQPDAFTRHFSGEEAVAGLRLRYAVEPEPLGTAGAIRFAAGVAGGPGGGDLLGQRVVVCNGDVLTHLDLAALLWFHEERGADATISLTRVDDPSAFGVVPTDEGGRVLGFVEKPPPGEAPTDWINAGTYVLEPGVIQGIPAGRNTSIERETFPGMLERGQGLYAVGSVGYWLDIGTPAKYLEANLDMVGGDVLLGASAAVAPTASVTSSVLGPSVGVGDGARVKNSVLLEGAQIGSGAAVSDSIVGAGARVGAGAVVLGVSVIGPGAVVAAGAYLDDARVEA